MKDFFETWKFKILIGIAVFLVGIMAYAGANDRLTAAPQELLSVAVAPFQKAAAMVGARVASLWENYTNIGAILDENEQLTAENAELRKQMVDYDRLKAENEAYKALANIQNTRPEMSCVSAFVIGRDPLDAFYGFTLDQGSVDGVELNDTVVSDEGYLLGVVVEVEATSCKVMTILHPNFNAAGVVSRTRDNGIITGSSDYAAAGLCGLLAFELLLLCFLLSAVMQLYFKTSAANVVLLETAAVLLVLSLDWLFFYYMPGYSGAVERYLWFVLPTAALTIPVCLVLFGAVRRIHAEFKIDNDVV